ncbi:MAG TPA: RluA family pseudouridine synthase [Thermoanaerobaculia bacterium]|nr:RluA family pseudouridine synthase [Thermoanaerobaculia bacterium]
MRIDLAVARRFGLSRRAAREAVRAGRVDLDASVCDEPGRDIDPAAHLAYEPNRPQRRQVRTRLAVLVEDPDFLIVEKPAGLLSVPTADHEKDTLLSRVLDYLHHRYGRRPSAFVVHRLDRDTSGALVFARNRETLQFLQRLFRLHHIEREYVALVEGDIDRDGTFDADLVRDAGNRRRGIAKPGEEGRRAVTRYRALERFGRATLVAVQLETGRTHQIRVHFASARHPVLGDSVYRRKDLPPPPLDAPRQMLHARQLGFPHPRTGKLVRAESPMPEDFQEVLAQLRRRAKPRLERRGPRVQAKSTNQEKRPGRNRGVADSRSSLKS